MIRRPISGRISAALCPDRSCVVPLPDCDWELPDPAVAPAGEELLAVGADLSPRTLVAAYSRGLFPMDIGRDGPLGWWSPDPRGVLPLDAMRVSQSLRASVRRFRVTIDESFDEARIVEVDAPGLTTPVLANVPWRRIPRPIFPIDPDTAWTPP